MRYISLLYSVLFVSILTAQNNEIELVRLKLDLSQNSITKIIQDSAGFMWFGTTNGLARYDGANITEFESDPYDSTTLTNNYITRITEGPDGTIWVGTQGGLSIFDKNKNIFKRFIPSDAPNSINHRIVSDIIKDQEGNMWVLSAVPYRYQQGEIGFKKYDIENIGEAGSDRGFFFKNKAGTLYFIHHQTIYYYDKGSDDFIKVFDERDITIASKSWIFSDIVEVNDTLWFASTTENGIVRVHLNNNELYIDKNDTICKSNASIFGHYISDIHIDRNRNLWIASEGGGILEYSLKDKTIRQSMHQPENEKSISHNSVRSICEDDNGRIWFGTYRNGFSILDKNYSLFKVIRSEKIGRGLSSNSITGFLEDKNGNLWIATDGGGLNYWDRKNNTFRYFLNKPNDENSLSSNAILSLCYDDNGNIWIGTWQGGISVFNPATEKFTKYNTQNSGLLSNIVFSIKNNANGKIVIASYLGGINIYDTKAGAWYAYRKYENSKDGLCDNNVFSITIVDENTFWAGTQFGGMNLVNIQNPLKPEFEQFQNSFDNPNSLISNTTRTLFLDRDKNLWVGTSVGLNYYNSQTKRFKKYTRKSGLPSNSIKSIIADNNGDIWVSTSYGLSRFDVDKKEFTNFSKEDGLQTGGFRSNSVYKLRSGELLFGGSEGFNIVEPDNLPKNTFPPKMAFTDFRISNEKVEIGENSPLKKHIECTKEITLNYDQATFSIDFVALNYTHPEKNSYAYKLEGVDEKWVFIGNQKRAMYTNVDPGEYVFKVKASNNNDVWNETGISLKINILPPWWKTWWFITLLAITVFSIVIGAFLFRIRVIKKQKELLEIRVKRRTYQLSEANEEMKEKQEEISLQKEELQKRNEELQRQQNEIKTKNEILEKNNFELNVQKEEIINQKNEIERITEEVKIANENKLRFFTSMSHEFRTPLTLILGPLENLKEKLVSDDEAMGNLSIIHKNSLRLLRLINEILDLRKIDTKNMKVKCVKGDIVPFVFNIVNAFKETAKKKDVELHASSNINSFSTWFDPGKIEIIFYNLVSNALRYTNAKGNIKVLIEKSIKDDIINFSVDDSGVGINNSKLNRIFDRFYQAEQNNTVEYFGTGIGLSLTKEIIESMQGKISVFSTPGKGTSFKIKLPIIIDPSLYDPDKFTFNKTETLHSNYKLTTQFIEELEDNYIPQKKKKKEQKEASNGTLLLVEDDADLRAYIASCLSNEYEVVEASNGKEGLELAPKVQPSLIISDIMMPLMDGIEFCKQIKNDVTTSHIPVILLTARTTIESQLESFETGADAFIPKPFNKKYLITRIKALIKSRDKLRKLFYEKNTLEPKEITVTSVDETFIANAKEAVERNMDNSEFGVDEMVKELGISRSVLYKKFKQLTNCSTAEFIKLMRLKRACQLLEKQQLRVSDICYMVGFNDPHSFSKIFKKHYGQTPSDFAKKSLGLIN